MTIKVAHHSFSYKGFEIWLAAIQQSKVDRGGVKRSLQVREKSGKGYQVIKSFRYDRTKPEAFSVASKKATEWIDAELLKCK